MRPYGTTTKPNDSWIDQLLATEGESEDRHRIFDELKTAMLAHERAEERFFYKRLIDGDTTQAKARHSIAEHHEMDELVEELEDKSMSSSAWLMTAKKLCEKLTHHLDEEEQEIFKSAGKELSKTEKNELAKDYQNEMSEQLKELRH